MGNKKRLPGQRHIALLVFALVLILVILMAQPFFQTPRTPPPVEPIQTPAPAQSPTPTGVWVSLFQRTPYPYTTPLPPAQGTILDGPYAKFDADSPQLLHCRRCPDYIPAGGIWRLHLDKGIYRIFYEGSNWKSLASFAVSGDRLYLFNDPYCPDEVGLYNWTLADGEVHRELVLEVIADECAIGLRAMNLSQLPWLSCLPPNVEAATTDHWEKPAGCDR